MIAPFRPATADVLLLYPGPSLREQVFLWNERRPERRVETSHERRLPEIRRLLGRSEAALIDAAGDPARATDAFLQAAARLGAGSVMMYAESADKELELFVRMRGSQFLLGPLFDRDWDEALESLLFAKRNVKLAA